MKFFTTFSVNNDLSRSQTTASYRSITPSFPEVAKWHNTVTLIHDVPIVNIFLFPFSFIDPRMLSTKNGASPDNIDCPCPPCTSVSILVEELHSTFVLHSLLSLFCTRLIILAEFVPLAVWPNISHVSRLLLDVTPNYRASSKHFRFGVLFHFQWEKTWNKKLKWLHSPKFFYPNNRHIKKYNLTSN